MFAPDPAMAEVPPAASKCGVTLRRRLWPEHWQQVRLVGRLIVLRALDARKIALASDVCVSSGDSFNLSSKDCMTDARCRRCCRPSASSSIQSTGPFPSC